MEEVKIGGMVRVSFLVWHGVKKGCRMCSLEVGSLVLLVYFFHSSPPPGTCIYVAIGNVAVDNVYSPDTLLWKGCIDVHACIYVS